MNVRLFRTRNGTMIHRWHCGSIMKREFTIGELHRPYTRRATPWPWADDKSEVEIACWITNLGYSTCKHCKPIDWNTIMVIKDWGGVPVTVLKRVTV